MRWRTMAASAHDSRHSDADSSSKVAMAPAEIELRYLSRTSARSGEFEVAVFRVLFPDRSAKATRLV